jgi:AraC-like DNA-binding protein
MPGGERWKPGPEVAHVGHVLLRAGQIDTTPREYTTRQLGLTLVLHGELDLRMDGFPTPEERPLMWLLPAGTAVAECYRKPLESWYVAFRCAGLAMRPRGAQIEVDGGGTALRVPRWKRLDPASAAAMVELYARLKPISERGGLAAAAHASALVLELLGEFLELPDLAPAGAGQRALERFRRLLDEQPFVERRIADLAREAGGSADHLRALFLRRFGIRPVEYRNHRRLARARELLAGGMKVKDAARAVGFSDPLYFSRRFRRRFGLSPRDVLRGAGPY